MHINNKNIIILSCTLVWFLFSSTATAHSLKKGFKVEKKITSAVSHNYNIELNNGEGSLIEVNQSGVDITVEVYGPSGSLIHSVDSPNGYHGIESVDFTANKSGAYQIQVKTIEIEPKTKASYQFEVKEIFSLIQNKQRVARQQYPTETLFKLWQSAQEDPLSVNRFLSNLDEQHLIEPIEGNNEQMLVTYFYQGSDDTDYVLFAGGPDFYGLRFVRLGTTNLFYCTQRVPGNAMFIYGFNEFKAVKAGPNKDIITRSMHHVFDAALYMPAAIHSPYIHVQKRNPKGELKTLFFESKLLDESRKLSVYLPVNYDATQPHNLIIQFDGGDYSAAANQSDAWQGWTPTSTILDNLIGEQKIAPTIAIMVWNQGNRSGDLTSDIFAKFIAHELIGWARENYNIHKDSSRVVLSGASRGGYAAANIAFSYSDIIGGVLSQSGSFWITGDDLENWPIYPEYEGKVITSYKNSPRLPVRFYLEAGLYDLGAGILGTNRQLRDILILKGYQVEHFEFNGGNSHVNWRNTLANGIVSLLGEAITKNDN